MPWRKSREDAQVPPFGRRTLILPSLLHVLPSGHDCCETVQVLLCASKEGLPVSVVADADFSFVQDEACDAAQFLATSAGNQQALNFTRFLSRSGTPSADVDSLDEKVALAFRHLKLPAEWNVLGTDQTLHGENANNPQTTLRLESCFFPGAAFMWPLSSGFPQRLNKHDLHCSKVALMTSLLGSSAELLNLFPP